MYKLQSRNETITCGNYNYYILNSNNINFYWLVATLLASVRKWYDRTWQIQWVSRNQNHVIYQDRPSIVKNIFFAFQKIVFGFYIISFEVAWNLRLWFDLCLNWFSYLRRCGKYCLDRKRKGYWLVVLTIDFTILLLIGW